MNNKDLLKFGKCLLIGIIVAIGGTFFSDLYGNIFNGSGDYRLSAIFGIGLYLCIVDKVIVRTPVSFSFILINGMEFAIDGREYSDGRKFKTREY